MAFADTQKLIVQLDLKGNLNAGLASAARAIKGFDKATANTQRSLSKFGRNIERGIVVGTGAAVAGFVAVAKAAGDFEAQMNTIATIVDRKDIPRIGADLRKTARDTGISLDDLTSAYYDLASAGIQGQLATEALNDAVKLGIGGLATTTETVNLMTTAINAYGLDAAGAAKATDQFAQAIADGTVKASEIAATFADVASIAKTYKIGIDQIAASYAFLTKQGVPAGEVTTEMQRAIVSLINPTKDLEKAEKKLGISFTKEIATKGLVGALQDLRVYSDKTGIPLIALLGRIEAVKYTLQTTGPNFKNYNAELAKMGQASGTAAKQMAERQQGLNYQLSRLKALAKDAGITIGSALLPKLTPLVAKLNDFISANQSKISDFGTKLADAFTKFADAVGKVDWKPFIDGLKLSGDIAKTIISAFRSLPEDLQKLVIAGFALNKVTGGLGTSIVKDLSGLILNKFAGRGSATDPMYVIDVTGGAAGAAGATGLLGKLGNVVMKVAVVGMVAEVADLIHGAISPGGGLEGRTKTNTLLPGDQLMWPFGPKNTPHVDLGPWRNILGGDSAFTVPGQGTSAKASGGKDDVADLKLLASAAAAMAQSAKTGKDDIVNLAQLQKSATSFLRDQFHEMLAHLSGAKTAAAIKAAIKEVELNVFQRGKGGVAGAEKTVKALKEALRNTHDPKLAAALKAELRHVEGKLDYRRLIAAQIKKADQIFRSGESSKRKIQELQAIERRIGNRNVGALQTVQAKIDALRKADLYAQHATTQAIKDQDMSVHVTIPVSNRVVVNAREVAASAKIISKYFAVAS